MAQVALTDIHPGWVNDALAGLHKGSLLTCRLLGKVPSSKPGDFVLPVLTSSCKGASLPAPMSVKAGSVSVKAVLQGHCPLTCAGGPVRMYALQTSGHSQWLARHLLTARSLPAGQRFMAVVQPDGAPEPAKKGKKGRKTKAAAEALPSAAEAAPVADQQPGPSRISDLAEGQQVRLVLWTLSYPLLLLSNLEAFSDSVLAPLKSEAGTAWHSPVCARQVKGYVKAAGPQGVFVALSRDVTGRVRLSNLSSSFVEKPEQAFPVGRMVQGSVLRIDPDRCALHHAWRTRMLGYTPAGYHGACCQLNSLPLSADGIAGCRGPSSADL